MIAALAAAGTIVGGPIAAAGAAAVPFECEIVAGADERRGQALCQAVAEALAARAEEAGSAPPDLRVTLKVLRANDILIEARLLWQDGAVAMPDGAPMMLDAVDAPLSTDLFPNFARSLLDHADLPL